MTLRNTGDMPYSDPICMALFNPANRAKIAEGDSYQADVYAQDSVKLQMVSTFNVTPGTYNLAFIDENGQKLHQPIAVEVLPTPVVTTSAESSVPLRCELLTQVDVTTGDAGWTRFSVPVSVPTGAHYVKFSFRGNVSNMAERLFLDNILVEDVTATGIDTAAAAPGQAAQTYDLLGRRIADRAVPERCSSARSLSGIYIELPADGSRQGKSGRKVVKR